MKKELKRFAGWWCELMWNPAYLFFEITIPVSLGVLALWPWAIIIIVMNAAFCLTMIQIKYWLR